MSSHIRSSISIVRYVDADMIPYDVGTSNMNLLLPLATPTVGQSVSFGTAFVEASRDYAIGVGIAQSKYYSNI